MLLRSSILSDWYVIDDFFSEDVTELLPQLTNANYTEMLQVKLDRFCQDIMDNWNYTDYMKYCLEAAKDPYRVAGMFIQGVTIETCDKEDFTVNDIQAWIPKNKKNNNKWTKIPRAKLSRRKTGRRKKKK